MAFFENMSTAEKEEFIVSLAVLICAEAKVEKENLDKVIKATGNTIAPYWTTIFSSHLNDKDVLDLIASPGAGAAAPAAAGEAAPAGEAAAAEEEKEEEEEEEDIDMSGGGLFGDDDDDW